MADPRSTALAPRPWIVPARPDWSSATARESRSAWIVPFVLASVLLSDRAFVLVATGGQGVLPILTLVAPLAAGAILVRSGLQRGLGFVGHPAFVFAVLPYLALTAILPVLGVMFHRFPERTMLSATEATTAASFLILGAAAARKSSAGWARWLPVAIAIEFLYALGQMINWSRGPGWELFTPFAVWDRSMALLEGQLGSAGRSTGLFTNPNELGLWASMATVLAWTLLTGRRRTIAVALAVITLLLSQARGPMVGLAAAVVIAAVIAVVRGRLVTPGGIRSAVAVGSGAALAVIAVATQLVDVPLDRFGALVQVFVEGPQADMNLAGRLNLWSGVVTLNLSYPWGTWGSPELLLGTAVDSLWFRVFAQGGAIYLAALALLIGAALALRGASHGGALRLAAVVLAVTGITQTSLTSPVSPVFWALLGIALQASFEARRLARPGVAWPHDAR